MLQCYWNNGVQTTVNEGSQPARARRGLTGQRWWERPAARLLRYRPWGGTPDPRASFFIFVRMYSFSLIWKFLVLCSFKISPQSFHPAPLCWRATPGHHCLSLPCPCGRGSVNLCFTAWHRPPQSIWRKEPFRETWGKEWGWGTSRFS